MVNPPRLQKAARWRRRQVTRFVTFHALRRHSLGEVSVSRKNALRKLDASLWDSRLWNFRTAARLVICPISGNRYFSPVPNSAVV